MEPGKELTGMDRMDRIKKGQIADLRFEIADLRLGMTDIKSQILFILSILSILFESAWGIQPILMTSFRGTYVPNQG
jgi:hypothetical protein